MKRVAECSVEEKDTGGNLWVLLIQLVINKARERCER